MDQLRQRLAPSLGGLQLRVSQVLTTMRSQYVSPIPTVQNVSVPARGQSISSESDAGPNSDSGKLRLCPKPQAGTRHSCGVASLAGWDWGYPKP